MQQEKMGAAEALQTTETTETTRKKQKMVWDVDSPEGCRRDTKEYLKKKLDSALQKLKELSETLVAPEEVPGLMNYEKV